MDALPTAWGERVLFGPFCLTPSERLLTREGVPIDLGGRALDLLTALIEQHGQVVPRQELLSRVWQDVAVDDSSLRFHIAGLRKALQDGKDGVRYITTQVGVGYGFVAPVQRLPAVEAQSSLAVRESSSVSTRAPEGALPARLARVFGRARDVQLLLARIAGSQLFTVVGAAGVGKTTFAVEMGHHLASSFAGQVSFVDLATLQDPALIPSAIAGALGIPVQADDALRVLLGHIRAQKRLLIMDNCEHLVYAVSSIVERIADAAPQVSILATSREPLRARGEHVYWLGPLDYPNGTVGLELAAVLAYPSVELFVARALAADSMLCIDLATIQSIADICRRLDGMALPIELAAVRAGAHGVEATARLLGERFSLRWAGRRTALPRQQTLQATLDWSYELLSHTEQLTFERLSIFLGPFSGAAVSEVIADEDLRPDEALIALDELTAKSLVSPVGTRTDSTYRLLEMTRTYARQKLLARGAAALDAVARRQAQDVLRSLEGAGAGHLGAQARAAAFSHQLGNVRTALAWCFDAGGELSIGVPLVAACAPVFLHLSLVVECRSWCERATAQLSSAQRGTAVELELQAALALSLMFTRGNSEAVEAALRRALAVAVALDDRESQLRVLARLHIFHGRLGDFATALGWAEMSLEVADSIGGLEAAAIAASLAGVSHHLIDDQTLARRELEFALQHSPPSDRNRTLHYGFDHRVRTGITLATTLWLQGYADSARRVAKQTVAEAERLEHPISHCIALVWTFSVYLWTGDVEQAQASIDTFARCAEVNAFGPHLAAAAGQRGQLAIQQRSTPNALEWLTDSLVQLRAARYELLTTPLELALAEGLSVYGRREEALALLHVTRARCHRTGELVALPELLRIKAQVIQTAACGATAEVEALLEESLACGRQQGARGWELRTTIDLARLWMQAGRPAKALALLQPLRAWFTEGSDTVDVRRADQLLGELAALVP